jgi:hypothetical protein
MLDLLLDDDGLLDLHGDGWLNRFAAPGMSEALRLAALPSLGTT